jgi:hypothetical protein
MNEARADLITMIYGQGVVYQASQQLPYYATLLPSLVVHEVRPAQTRPDSLYITNGLSAPTDESATGCGFELQIIAPAGKTWPITLLVSLAAHTQRTGNTFEPGQSIALTSSLAGTDDTLNALIFTQAPGLPYRFAAPEGEIQVVTVVGVTSDEFDWARRYSAHELVALMQLCGQGVATLPGRRSVVPGAGGAARSTSILGTPKVSRSLGSPARTRYL